MMIGNTNDPTGAATPIVGPGNNPYTNCITIPLEEYRKLIECSVNMDIIDKLAGDKDIYRTLVTGPDVVPRDEYNKLLNVSAKKIHQLEKELEEAKANPAHICPKCGRQFFETPAVSRRDLKQEICSVCAATEALEDAQKAGAMTTGEAKEVQKIVEEIAKEDEVVPGTSTPEQRAKGGKKTQMGKKVDLPMDEIRRLKAEGWSNVKIAKKYGVADVTIGCRLKKDAEKKAAEKVFEPAQTDGKRPLDIADLRARREAGETYEQIGQAYGGWTEDEVHAFIIQKNKEERS